MAALTHDPRASNEAEMDLSSKISKRQPEVLSSKLIQLNNDKRVRQAALQCFLYNKNKDENLKLILTIVLSKELIPAIESRRSNSKISNKKKKSFLNTGTPILMQISKMQ